MDIERTERDRKLVERMLAGDQLAFEEFADEMIPRVHRYAMRRLSGDQELASDIVQTTLCKAIAKLSTYRGESTLLTWLCACCRNEIAMHFRSASRRRDDTALEPLVEPAQTDALWPGAGEPSAEAKILQEEKSGLVHLALDELPAKYANALEWKYLESLPVQEIADRLGIGPKAAESVLTRARVAFKNGYRQLLERSRGPIAAGFGERGGRG